MANNWQKIGDRDALATLSRGVFFMGPIELVVFKTKTGYFACENACPHKGFPLIDGEIDEGPLLTCPWHDMTFNLTTGCPLAGGLRLNVFEVEAKEQGLFAKMIEMPEKGNRVK